MAEKSEVDTDGESIAHRLKRKRETFYKEKDSEYPSRSVKRRKSAQNFDTDSTDVSTNDQTLMTQEKQSTEYGVDVECCRRCDRSFFSTDCQSLAKSLLGSVLVRRLDNGAVCRGKIVETEAYLGGEDKASHSFNGKKTKRNAAMFMHPGTAYVYSIYGMHYCFNISSDGDGSAVLVRALEPLEGEEYMRERRKAAKRDRDLCSGPAKLCQALGIDLSCNKVDLVSCDSLWVEPRPQTTPLTISDVDIVKSTRIGVKYAGEWAEKPLRFYIKGNASVSKS